jgi:hypothetical protein
MQRAIKPPSTRQRDSSPTLPVTVVTVTDLR